MEEDQWSIPGWVMQIHFRRNRIKYLSVREFFYGKTNSVIDVFIDISKLQDEVDDYDIQGMQCQIVANELKYVRDECFIEVKNKT